MSRKMLLNMLMDQKHLVYERGASLYWEYMDNSLQPTLLWMAKLIWRRMLWNTLKEINEYT
jgi:hypothetical protein